MCFVQGSTPNDSQSSYFWLLPLYPCFHLGSSAPFGKYIFWKSCNSSTLYLPNLPVFLSNCSSPCSNCRFSSSYARIAFLGTAPIKSIISPSDILSSLSSYITNHHNLSRLLDQRCSSSSILPPNWLDHEASVFLSYSSHHLSCSCQCVMPNCSDNLLCSFHKYCENQVGVFFASQFSSSIIFIMSSCIFKINSCW